MRDFRAAFVLAAALLLGGCAVPHAEIELPPGIPVETALPSTIRFVLFAPGSSRLDDAARATIAGLVADVASGRVGPETGALPADLPPFEGRIRVTGFTDAAEAAPGSAAARRLARERARSVATLLAASGIAADRLVVEEGSAGTVLIPVEAGVPEPANRRVEILPVVES